MPDVTDAFLGGIRDFVAGRLKEHGLSQHEATLAGSSVVAEVKAAWVSGLVYITKAHRYSHLLMARNIYQDFNGSNHSELCKKYNKSIPQIYNIIRQIRAEYVRLHQRDLFDDQSPDNSKVAEFMRLGLETLSQLMGLCEQGLQASVGIDRNASRKIGEELADWVAQEYGGQFIYIKMDSGTAADNDQGDLFCREPLS